MLLLVLSRFKKSISYFPLLRIVETWSAKSPKKNNARDEINSRTVVSLILNFFKGRDWIIEVIMDKQKRRKLAGRNIFSGEKRVIVLKIVIKVSKPSFILTVLFPFLFLMEIGVYLTFNSSLKKIKVMVVVREKPLGRI